MRKYCLLGTNTRGTTLLQTTSIKKVARNKKRQIEDIPEYCITATKQVSLAKNMRQIISTHPRTKLLITCNQTVRICRKLAYDTSQGSELPMKPIADKSQSIKQSLSCSSNLSSPKNRKSAAQHRQKIRTQNLFYRHKRETSKKEKQKMEQIIES
eukprot:TRINITY_DN50503_c0_g1_i1.p1 TRINITY_DN50503_c0_g1~~TRINITY_DN50503_c0_g1_i1.p1  ORF type:complete len:179 (-),score=1.31 TRINITY_DN50503_c0_g1_i1:218-682(-)